MTIRRTWVTGGLEICLAMGLVAGAGLSLWLVPAAAGAGLLLDRTRRLVVSATDAGVDVTNFFGASSLRWDEVEAFEAKLQGLRIRAAGDRRIPLDAIVVFGVRPSVRRCKLGVIATRLEAVRP